jgi:hypothetical protein
VFVIIVSHFVFLIADAAMLVTQSFPHHIDNVFTVRSFSADDEITHLLHVCIELPNLVLVTE